MAAIKFEISKDKARKDGTCPILLRVALFGCRFRLSTGVYTSPEVFASDGGRNGGRWIFSGERRDYLNQTLQQYLALATQTLMRLNAMHEKRGLPVASLRAEFLRLMQSGTRGEATLIATMLEFIEGKQERTRGIYLATVAKLRKYLPSDIALERVDRAWLERFQKSELAYTGVNSVAIHLRNIRATFNFAIDEELTRNYPFRHFQIKREVKPARALDIRQLVELISIEPEPYQRLYRDLFLLSLYLIGINPTDLLHLKAGSLVGGRIRYNRQKTGTFYNVKVEPEAAALLERLKGKQWLLCPLDTWQYKNFLHNCNKGLRLIGPFERVGRGGRKIHHPIYPRLTMYCARYTWATLAAQLDVPDATIAAALGHEHLNRTTAVYVNFDQRKIDAANRKVLDYIRKHL
ncbi:MAG: site-specific integrase [Prevotellaceae bacterium]|nr:site-specific integrase [Prevotellaceae bacterium]